MCACSGADKKSILELSRANGERFDMSTEEQKRYVVAVVSERGAILVALD